MNTYTDSDGCEWKYDLPPDWTPEKVAALLEHGTKAGWVESRKGIAEAIRTYEEQTGCRFEPEDIRQEYLGDGR